MPLARCSKFVTSESGSELPGARHLDNEHCRDERAYQEASIRSRHPAQQASQGGADLSRGDSHQPCCLSQATRASGRARWDADTSNGSMHAMWCLRRCANYETVGHETFDDSG